MPLTSRQTRHLRGLAHHLNPVVMLGREGVSEAVCAKVRDELEHHELIKVRAGDGCLETIREVGTALAARCDAELVQTIGHVAVLYRRRRKDPTIVLGPP